MESVKREKYEIIVFCSRGRGEGGSIRDSTSERFLGYETLIYNLKPT